MILFKNNSSETPYILFKEKYDEAFLAKQKLIEAISVSSFSIKKNEVDSRFVNLNIVDNKNFIFFTNYNSPKSIQFSSFNQVAISIYWQTINVQIRMKAKIQKTSLEFNNIYFSQRTSEKNALAISSSQSEEISSYENVKKNYNNVLARNNLEKCPEYWGGYSFSPYYFEFWEGHESRLNKREVYEKSDDSWKHLILQP
jgi:pyridoxamine 5'-phosphate oxidase